MKWLSKFFFLFVFFAYTLFVFCAYINGFPFPWWFYLLIPFSMIVFIAADALDDEKQSHISYYIHDALKGISVACFVTFFIPNLWLEPAAVARTLGLGLLPFTVSAFADLIEQCVNIYERKSNKACPVRSGLFDKLCTWLFGADVAATFDLYTVLKFLFFSCALLVAFLAFFKSETASVEEGTASIAGQTASGAVETVSAMKQERDRIYFEINGISLETILQWAIQRIYDITAIMIISYSILDTLHVKSKRKPFRPRKEAAAEKALPDRVAELERELSRAMKDLNAQRQTIDRLKERLNPKTATSSKKPGSKKRK